MAFDVTFVTTMLAAGTMATLLVGYARALGTRNGAVFHLVASIILVFGAYIARTLYWDWIAPSVMVTPYTRDDINPWFDAVAVWGGVHGHIAIYKMIPDEDRRQWHILTAWLYPPFAMSTWLWATLKRLVRWRS